jgi:DNA-binding transcriptional regulator YiaG
MCIIVIYMAVSSNNVADSAAVSGKKLTSSTRKFIKYEAARRDRETPFNGHQCKALRAQLGYTVKRLARLVNCSTAHMAQRESSGGDFGVHFRARLHEIKRLADKAQADLRDRFEMPNFNK